MVANDRMMCYNRIGWLMIIEFKTNGDDINYKVALEILGQERQPFMMAINQTNPGQERSHISSLMTAYEPLSDTAAREISSAYFAQRKPRLQPQEQPTIVLVGNVAAGLNS